MDNGFWDKQFLTYADITNNTKQSHEWFGWVGSFCVGGVTKFENFINKTKRTFSFLFELHYYVFVSRGIYFLFIGNKEQTIFFFFKFEL